MSAERIERRLYFDIDKTVINSDLLKQNIISALAEHCNVSKKIVASYLVGYQNSLLKSTDFDPKELAAYIAQHKTGFTTQQLESVILNEKNFDDIVFSDFLSTVTKISLTFAKNHLRVGTYSEGVKFWQELKLLLAGIDGEFDGDLRIIRRRKLAAAVLEELPEGSAVVDDKKEVVDTLAEARPDIHPIWINRNSKEVSSKTGVHTIFSLRELSPLLKTLWLGSDQSTQAK
ncbi:MAG: hypothetical protein GW947_00220 [Candidatus Pacebacteria bacterium]|nr:hypothetical protein [Candidatus Paceibacterota bacterium]PIR59516.1 MAG: hypothetical protein COU68_05160 [Candidatus Pacebacteria bacterium CG10_big_fil_rev_8_21_14_0_10_45_6]